MGGGQDLTLKVLLQAQNLAGGAFSALGDLLSGLKGPLAVAEGAALALGAAIVGIAAKSVQMAAQYQQSLNMVQALTGASSDQMAQYDAGLKSLAVDAGVAPNALAQGLYQVISAGYAGAQAMKILTLATQDSKIGMTSAAVTSEALTNVLANFSWQTKNATLVNGMMLETVTLGKSTFQQYASTITKAASTSAQFHISLQTMSAAWATMTANGISAGKASTDYVQLVQAMDGKVQTIAKSLAKNGIAFNEAAFNAATFGGKVQMLNQVLQEAAQKHVQITGVTLQAAQAVTVIAGHMDAYNSNLKTLSNTQAMGEKTAQAWAITQSGFNQQMSRAGAAVQVLMIDIGQALLPVLTKLVSAVVPVISQLAAWITKSGMLQQVVGILQAAIVGVVNVIGTLISTGAAIVGFFQKNQIAVDLLIGVLGGIAIAIGAAVIPAMISAGIAAVASFGAWAVAAGAAALATLAAAAPFILIGAIAAAVIFGIIEAIQHWGAIVTWVGGIFSWLGSHVHAVVTPIVGFFERAAAGIAAVFTPIVNVFRGIFTVIGYIVEIAIGVIILYFELWFNIIKAIFTPIVNFFRTIWSGIVLVFTPVVEWFGHVFGAAVAIVQTVWGKITDFFKLEWAGIMLIWGAVSAFFGAVFSKAGAIIKAVWTPIADWFGAIFSGMGSVIHTVIDAIGQKFSDLGTFVKGIWTGITDAIKGAINMVIGLINTVIQAVDGIHVNTPFGSIGFNIPQIPQLAMGGMVMNSGIVDVHAGERMFLPAGTAVAGPGSLLARGSASGYGGGYGGGTYNSGGNMHVDKIEVHMHVSGKMTDADVNNMIDLVNKGLAHRWRSNSNIQVATSGSTRR